MAFEETEPSTSPPPPEASAIPVVEDPKDQEENASLKENPKAFEVAEDQTLLQEGEGLAKEGPGQHVDVVETGTEVGGKNEAEGEITEVEAEAGVGVKGENEFHPPGSEAAEVGSGHQVKIEAEDGAGAELGSQAENENGVPAELEAGADDVGTAEPDGDEETEKPHKLTVDDIKTAPMDFRFPTTNQSKHCFTRYVEYHKCVQAKGDDPDCNKYAQYYRSLCPGEWVDRWNEQRENGTFPGPL